MKNEIYGSFSSMTLTEEGKLIINFLSDNNEKFIVEIESLIKEDGSGRKFLINHKHVNSISGYVDFATNKGYIKIKN
jgi:hypothetical protein